MQKFINPQKPSPLSYISSAFKVQQDQRARHSLQLAEYLHTQIQIPCVQLLKKFEEQTKNVQKQIRRLYKQGEAVEQIFLKHWRKIQKSRRQWQQEAISAAILNFTHGISKSHKQKIQFQLQQQRIECIQLQKKYYFILDQFNKYAQSYNRVGSSLINIFGEKIIDVVDAECASLRKLIVSEINMFKNIQYDLINISKQMQAISPQNQVKYFSTQKGIQFNQPILTCYKQEYRYPVPQSMLQSSLTKIQKNNFTWMLQNKHNSTIQMCLINFWKGFGQVNNKNKQIQGQKQQNRLTSQTDHIKQEMDIITQLQQVVKSSLVVKNMPIDQIASKQKLLDSQEAFSIAFAALSSFAGLINPKQLTLQKQKQSIQNIRKYMNIHHFYRSFFVASIEALLQVRKRKINIQIQRRLISIFKMIVEESIKIRDIFVIRSILSILFSCQGSGGPIWAHPDILKLNYWEGYELWEAIFFEGIYEQISLIPLSQRAQLQQINTMRQKNIVFSSLTTYCYYIVMLGIQFPLLKNIVNRVCRIYLMHEEYEKDLIKFINQTYAKRDITYKIANNPISQETN